jgi:hypothetical protein
MEGRADARGAAPGSGESERERDASSAYLGGWLVGVWWGVPRGHPRPELTAARGRPTAPRGAEGSGRDPWAVSGPAGRPPGPQQRARARRARPPRPTHTATPQPRSSGGGQAAPAAAAAAAAASPALLQRVRQAACSWVRWGGWQGGKPGKSVEGRREARARAGMSRLGWGARGVEHSRGQGGRLYTRRHGLDMRIQRPMNTAAASGHKAYWGCALPCRCLEYRSGQRGGLLGPKE